jgi:2-C-methyl-D-erythritol 4-phosphate cytidylyltransferase/2-C-methyl-D-erythritol 2,4-cyclodiphosphate synthase
MNPGTPRVGVGYDVHRLAPRRRLMLGGVHIPYRLGLLGHSDADVLIHAVCDALLGAASLGDIGKHFPDSSRKYKNISSLVLLGRVRKLIADRDFEIVHIDSTLILQQPKIQQYVPRMQRNVARVLGIRADQVSIKATTSEGLGFAGRGEGGAALAVATVLPFHKH